MTYTEADLRRVMNEAYRHGVEEGIRRAKEAQREPARNKRLLRTTA